MTIGHGSLTICLAAPDQHAHIEGPRITRQALANLAIAPDGQRLPIQAFTQVDLPLAGYSPFMASRN